MKRLKKGTWAWRAYCVLGYRIADDEDSDKMFGNWMEEIKRDAKKESVENIIKQLKHEREVRADIRSVLDYVIRIIEERHLSNSEPKGSTQNTSLAKSKTKN